MATIVISDPETSLSVESTHFSLRAGGRKIGRIPLGIMEQVVIHHGVEVTRKAMSRLGACGIPVTFLDAEGRVECRLVPAWKFDAAPRLGQARAWFCEATRLRLARRFVDAKLANASAVVRLHAGNHPAVELAGVCERLRESRADLRGAPDTNAIMGVEGMASRIYFGALGRMLRVQWTTFTGRTRRPPLDPVNAVLSYLYAVLTHQMMSYLEALGLDPYIGYLHTNESRRPTLALDMIEPFRALLGDRLMLRLLNLGTLRPEHFEERNGPGKGTFINADGRTALLKVYADWSRGCDETLAVKLTSPGHLLLAEAERFRQHAKAGDLANFEPYYRNADDATPGI